MTYSSHTWVSGEVITAANINNLETQYTEAMNHARARFSTASTGTTVLTMLATTGTYSSNATASYQFIGCIAVPQGVQPSRLELSMTAQRLSTTIANDLSIMMFPGYSTYSSNTNMPQSYNTSIVSTWTTAAAGNTRTTGFSADGGDYLGLFIDNAATTSAKIWNIKISGTTTSIVVDDALSWKYFNSRNLMPTTTGTG